MQRSWQKSQYITTGFFKSDELKKIILFSSLANRLFNLLCVCVCVCFHLRSQRGRNWRINAWRRWKNAFVVSPSITNRITVYRIIIFVRNLIKIPTNVENCWWMRADCSRTGRIKTFSEYVQKFKKFGFTFSCGYPSCISFSSVFRLSNRVFGEYRREK